jgi:hypothetical protein
VSLLLVRRCQTYVAVVLLKGKWGAGIVGRECLSMNEYVGYSKVLTCINGTEVKTYWKILH